MTVTANAFARKPVILWTLTEPVIKEPEQVGQQPAACSRYSQRALGNLDRQNAEGVLAASAHRSIVLRRPRDRREQAPRSVEPLAPGLRDVGRTARLGRYSARQVRLQG